MSTSLPLLFGGIEGGATCSKFVVVTGDGEVIVEQILEGLNYHLLGLEETAERVAQVLFAALAQHCNGRKLSALGLGFSGAKDGSSENEEFLRVFKLKYSHVADTVAVVSDTLGTLKSTLPNGGAAIIAGTGSSCFLEHEGSFYRCGGNGHLIGDKGSGFWIALRAIKYVINEQSAWETPPYESTLIRKLMHEYFSINDDMQILDHLYKSFSKSKISGFCKELAKNGSDKLCAAIFDEAGFLLGAHVNVVLHNAERDKKKKITALQVIAIGSVFKSWVLLKKGFLRGVFNFKKPVNLSRLSIYLVEGTVAKGLAYMAAVEAGFMFPYDFRSAKSLLYEHKFGAESVS